MMSDTERPATGWELTTAIAVRRLVQLRYPISKDVKEWAYRRSSPAAPNLGTLIRETIAKEDR